MDIQTLTTFFMWCTILNFGLYVIMILSFGLAPDLFYAKYGKYWGILREPLPRETFKVVWFSAFALWRVLWSVFNLVPFVALLIMG